MLLDMRVITYYVAKPKRPTFRVIEPKNDDKTKVQTENSLAFCFHIEHKNRRHWHWH